MPIGRQPFDRRVHVVDRDRDVPVTGADLVRLILVAVPGQLEPRTVVLQTHEDVDRFVPDRQATDLLEAELLVELDRTVDVEDPVTGVDELTHGLSLSGRVRIETRSALDAELALRRGPVDVAGLVDRPDPEDVLALLQALQLLR